MKKKNNFTWVFTLLVLVLVGVLVCVGCAPKVEPSAPAALAEKAAIPVAILGDWSGPYASTVRAYVAGMTDAGGYISSHGGIGGHPLKLELFDHGGDVKKALSLYSSFAVRDKNKPPIYIGISSTVDMALKERLPEDEIVEVTTGASGTALYPPGWIFSIYPAYPNIFGGFIDWMVEDWEKTGTHPGNPRLAILTWDIAFGHSIYTDETIAYCKAKGVDLLEPEWTPVSPVSLIEPLMRLRGAEADWIVGWHQHPLMALELKDAYSLGMIPPKVRFAAINTGVEYALYDLAPDEVKAIEPICIAIAPSWGEKDNPLVQAYDKMFRENGRNPSDRLCGYFLGSRAVVASATMLQMALDAVGAESLNGKAVYDVAVTMTDVDLDEAIFGMPGYVATYGPEKRCTDKMQLQQAKKEGDILPITGWYDAPDRKSVV